MCNPACMIWAFRNIERSDIYGKRVLEVGSLNVNGSARVVIERLGPAEYVGVDIVEGNGVDLVCKAEDLVSKFGEESFDFVVSTCALEHIEDWKSSVSNIKRVCKKDGHVLIIVPAKWPKHDYPYDFWRFSKDKLVHIFSDFKILKLYSDYFSGRDGDGNITPCSLVYMKCRKEGGFKEIDLTECEVEEVL